MQTLSHILLALHLLGMAAIVGAFFVQMRAKGGFATGLMLGGAITQLVTGVGMIGIYEATRSDGGHGVSAILWVHLGVGLAILAAAIAGVVLQRRGGRVKAAFHTAGGLAIVNVLIAGIFMQH